MLIFVRSSDESLSRALNLHLHQSSLGQSQVSLRSVSGQSQVSPRSVSGQSQASLRPVSGQSQASLRSVPGQSQVSLSSLLGLSDLTSSCFWDTLYYSDPGECRGLGLMPGGCQQSTLITCYILSCIYTIT